MLINIPETVDRENSYNGYTIGEALKLMGIPAGPFPTDRIVLNSQTLRPEEHDQRGTRWSLSRWSAASLAVIENGLIRTIWF